MELIFLSMTDMMNAMDALDDVDVDYYIGTAPKSMAGCTRTLKIDNIRQAMAIHALDEAGIRYKEVKK